MTPSPTVGPPPYDSGVVSALSGDVPVALVDRSSPSVRWIQGGIVTERTRLSVVSITHVTEGSTELVLGEDVEVNVARQRLTRVAGALGSGTTLTVRYVADRLIEDSVSSNRPVHLTEHAEFDTASIGGRGRHWTCMPSPSRSSAPPCGPATTGISARASWSRSPRRSSA